MRSLPPNTAPVLYREAAPGLPFSEDSTHGFVCREEERVHLADVIMQLRNMVTAFCHSVLAKACTCARVCKGVRNTWGYCFMSSPKGERK